MGMRGSFATRPQDRRTGKADGPLSGSVLFPDLVWAHWWWQRAAHPYWFPRPYRFPHPGVLLRRSPRAAALSARHPGSRNGTGPFYDADAPKLKGDYEAALASFQQSAGGIIRAYWCA